MESKLYQFTNNELQALIVFLDRVEYKGLQEVQLISRIIEVLKCPIEQSKQQEG
jgi:hypothetical protein